SSLRLGWRSIPSDPTAKDSPSGPVPAKIMGATPVVGNQIQELVQGGPQYGHHTLTRFFAMHAGLLPALLVGCLAIHIYVFRRHGITVAKPEKGPTGVFWPDQILMDSVACLGVLAVLLALAVFNGAELSAPADPSQGYSAARPEWYFLFLFRFLKFEAVEHFGLAFGAIYVPGAIMGLICLMPLIGWWKAGHKFNVAFMWLLMTGIVALTGLAFWEDSTDVDHQAAVAEAERDSHRILELASGPLKIPVTGAVTLLREDPFTQGPRLFAKHCSSCHHYNGHDGRGRITKEQVAENEYVAAKPTAPDLGDLGSREWMRKILVDFESHFAPVRNAAWFGKEDGIDPTDSEMNDWSGDRDEILSDANAESLKAIIEYMVSRAGRTDLKPDPKLVELGQAVAIDGNWAAGGTSCTDCHDTMGDAFEDTGEGDGSYPDIAEYLSEKWLKAFIRNPGSDQFYSDRNHMPAYAEKMTDEELDLLVKWLRADYMPTHIEDYDVSKTPESETADPVEVEIPTAPTTDESSAENASESDSDSNDSDSTDSASDANSTE
ncbi:MAG: cytochrome b N-terminal domain-containing protein, partial [Planctomycetota bacterium]